MRLVFSKENCMLVDRNQSKCFTKELYCNLGIFNFARSSKLGVLSVRAVQQLHLIKLAIDYIRWPMSCSDPVHVICDNGRVIWADPERSVEEFLDGMNQSYYKRGCRLVDASGKELNPGQTMSSLVPPVRLTGGVPLTTWQGKKNDNIIDYWL